MTDKTATVRTADGRTLAYTEAGERNGAPVFYFHGLPGSRSDFDRPLGQEALAGSGVRLIGVDRPGFGASEFQPGRRYEDWPADVAIVADELGIGRFGVLGYSAGGPYVVACAQALPDRLTFAGILSGVGPAETPRFRHRMAKTDAIMTWLARVASPLARLAIKQATRTAERSPEKFSRRFDKDLSAPDLELHRDPAFRQAVREIFLESTRHGPAGVVHEYMLSGTRWGLRFEEVDFPIQLWHGEADAIVPLHHAEYVAGRLANAKLTVLPGTGHLHTPARWHDYFAGAAAAHTTAPRCTSGESRTAKESSSASSEAISGARTSSGRPCRSPAWTPTTRLGKDER
jgi:pimeloyl-ACP methyl ester carboxylesterase